MSAKVAILFGPNSDSHLARIVNEQKKGDVSLLFSGKHAHELHIPSQRIAICDMHFAHFLPSIRDRRVTEQDIMEWTGQLLSDISFGSNPVDTPTVSVTPGDKPNEVNLFFLWLQPINSEVCVRAAQHLEKKYRELGGFTE